MRYAKKGRPRDNPRKKKSRRARLEKARLMAEEMDRILSELFPGNGETGTVHL